MANEKPQQNELDLRNYFGFDDAAEEKALAKVFVQTPEFKDLKIGKKDEGSFVITGLKGTGKTAMCRYIESSSQQSLLWRVDNEKRFLNVHAEALGKYPSEVESVLLNLILTEVSRQIVSEPNKFPSDGVASVKALLPKLADHFVAFLKKGKVKAKFVEWDLDKVFDSGKRQFTQFGIDPYVGPLKKCFATKPAVVLFDDIDDVFLGADTGTYPTFIEGLARAAKTINLALGHHLHFLVFLKYGVFRAFHEKPRDYEKVRNYIAVLKWNEEELETMLVRRIVDKLQLSTGQDPALIWAKIFHPTTSASAKEIRQFLFDRCAGGPRDVIHYCNRAVEFAKKAEITMETLRECEAQFSRDKLTQIYEDYGYTYPDVHDLIRICFQGAKATFQNEEFRDFIFTQILGKQKVADLFGKYGYFEKADVDQMIQLLYTVGFIGYGLKKGPEIYVLTDPRGEDLFEASHYSVHPAFRKALRISN
jgi:hypothetical protein